MVFVYIYKDLITQNQYQTKMSCTHTQRSSSTDCEDQDTMYHCAYYVQSPSTFSLANVNSPTRSETTTTTVTTYNSNKTIVDTTKITLSHYSSSRGSSNSFLPDSKKVDGDDRDNLGKNRLIIVNHRHDDKEEEEDEEEYWSYGSGKRSFWWRYFSFERSNSCGWVSIQIGWRFFLSLLVSLLVFYIATKPPPPHVSLKVLYYSFSLFYYNCTIKI